MTAPYKLGLKSFSYAVDKIPDSVWHKIPYFRPQEEDEDDRDADLRKPARRSSKSSSVERNSRRSSGDKRRSRSLSTSQSRGFRDDGYHEPVDIYPKGLPSQPIPEHQPLYTSSPPQTIPEYHPVYTNSPPQPIPEYQPKYSASPPPIDPQYNPHPPSNPQFNPPPPNLMPQYVPPDPYTNPPPASYPQDHMASDPYYPQGPASEYRPYDTPESPRRYYNPQNYAPPPANHVYGVDTHGQMTTQPNGYPAQPISTSDQDRYRRRHNDSPSDSYDQDRRNSRSQRKKPSSGRSGSDEHGFKSKLQRTFEPSEKGLADSAIGAVAGGLIGHEVGHGPFSTIAGVLLGGLGGNAWAARENRHREARAQDRAAGGGSGRRSKSEGRRSSRQYYDDYDRRDDRRRGGVESDEEDEGYDSGRGYDGGRGYDDSGRGYNGGGRAYDGRRRSTYKD